MGTWRSIDIARTRYSMQTIKQYIENQKWDEDEQGFKITAPTEP